MPAWARIPPTIFAHDSNPPSASTAPAGFPATNHALAIVRRAQSSSPRCSRTQLFKSGCRKPTRWKGKEVPASSLIHTHLRGRSPPSWRLLPVAIQVHRTGNVIVLVWPRILSVHVDAVTASVNVIVLVWPRILSVHVDAVTASARLALWRR